MRLFLNIILVIATILASYVEFVYFTVVPPKLGKAVPFTVRSQGFFTFDQDKALGGRRDIALSQYVPLYTYLPGNAQKAMKRMEELIKEISFLQEQKPFTGNELVEYLQEAFGLKLDLNEADKFLRYQNMTNLLNGILTVEKSIMQNIIAEDSTPYSGKITVEVIYPDPKGIVSHPTDEILTLKQARFILQDEATKLFWQVDKGILEPVIEILQSALLPTLKYDKDENNRRIEEIVRRYPSKVIHYQPGDVLVPFRKVLDEEDLLLVVSHLEFANKNLYNQMPFVMIVTLLIVLFNDLFILKILGSGQRKTIHFRPLLSLLIISVLFFKSCLLFTFFPLYFVPFAMLPLIIILLNQGRVAAAWASVIGAILLTLLSGRSFQIFLFFTFAGLSAVLLSSKIRKRIHIFLPSIVVGMINVGVLLAFSIKWQNIIPLLGNSNEIWMSLKTMVFEKRLSNSLGWAFTGGILSGPIALCLLPILEVGRYATSNFKLAKYSDLQHPLLKDLFSKVPATYQHSMTMASLAQAAGEAVGANTLLLRTGAYYHDIGKMADPNFFSENQSSGENPHDTMDPLDSAQIIIGHVKHGEQIGRENGLPEVILDLIKQHHGTLFVEFFYNKAIKANNKPKPRKTDFRYPGPKPQSLEAAILMIVDSVEATFRSMEAPTQEQIEKMILLNIVKRIADGQFDECNFSTSDIAKIVETLTHSIEATFHSRVTYPWQEKKKL
ncbi:MAG: HDIG domain-containing protein [Deltaproteobacteria bacterium]|jgi:putative nucleotidyltransferase with HDIG domain|nr:HDIG domain-containing protein [Deltaproteobacteria bacterium]